MQWSDFEQYLKPAHLKGKPARVEIADIKTEKHYNQDRAQVEPVPVIFFKNAKRPLVVSPANRKALAQLFGDDCSAAIGKSVLLVPAVVKAFGKEQETIRIMRAPDATPPQ